MKTVRYCRERLKDDVKRLQKIQEVFKERYRIRVRMSNYLYKNKIIYNIGPDEQLIEVGTKAIEQKKLFKFTRTTTLKE